MKKLRILVLMHAEAVPPDDLEGRSQKEIENFKTEFDICQTLSFLGHEVHKLGVVDELASVRSAIREFKPHLAFNLLEAFHGEGIFDQHMVSYLELLRVPYSGCNPRGLTLARDKGLSKKILSYHRIRVPDFVVFPMGRKVRRPKRLDFPLFVKSLVEDASYGIAQASLIQSDDKLVERVHFVHDRLHTDAIAERFIEGRELFVPILGNVRLQVLPTWEFIMKDLPEDQPLINTERAKFDLEYQKRFGISHGPAKDLPPEVEKRIGSISKRIYRVLGLSGYARLDFRLDPEGRLFFLEANPNPEIAEDEEVASSAALAGIPYEKLIQKIVSLGLSRAPKGKPVEG